MEIPLYNEKIPVYYLDIFQLYISHFRWDFMAIINIPIIMYKRVIEKAR